MGDVRCNNSCQLNNGRTKEGWPSCKMSDCNARGREFNPGRGKINK